MQDRHKERVAKQMTEQGYILDWISLIGENYERKWDLKSMLNSPVLLLVAALLCLVVLSCFDVPLKLSSLSFCVCPFR